MSEDIDFRTVGDKDWRWLRKTIVMMIEDANTEKQFHKALQVILFSCGTKKEIIKRRKQMGFKPFTKEELKQMDEEK